MSKYTRVTDIRLRAQDIVAENVGNALGIARDRPGFLHGVPLLTGPAKSMPYCSIP